MAGEEGTYRSYKWSIFASMYLGYTMLFLDRKSFSFAMPAIIKEQGLDKDDLGLIMSSQLLAYSISKFLGGMATDVISPRVLFATGLFLSGITLLIFTMFESKMVYAILWFVLGFVQGGGWPACGKILRQWFAPDEFGTWWSILSTGMNVASSIGPILTTILIDYAGWRQAMRLFGTVSVAMVGACFMVMVDSPEKVGLTAPHLVKKEEKGKPRGRGRGTWRDLLQSPLLWLLGLSYLVVLMVRSAVQDWGQLYLIQDRGQSEYVASCFLSFLELGGIVGSVVAGYLGDKAVSMMPKSESHRDDIRGSPRLYVIMGFISLVIVSLHLIIFTISETSSQKWISIVGFFFGFGIYGPIAVYGVMAIESAPSHLSGTSHAIVGLFANVGGVTAGLPFSYIATAYEWSGAFVVLEILCILILIFKILGRNVEYKMVPIKKKLQ